MLPWESRRERRKGRAGRRPDVAPLERLEGRELLSFSPLGYSLPDLTVTGFAAPAAAWGGPLNVTVNVKNTGADTLIDPLVTVSGSDPTATAGPTTVAVFASPRANSRRGEVLIGSFDIASVPENSLEQLNGTFTLPSRPRGFPGSGGKIFLRYVINPAQTTNESRFANNVGNTSPVLIEAPLPQLQAIALSVPSRMQPGDTIAPSIQIANVGTADTSDQGPVTVALVASVDRSFGPGSSIVASYQVSDIPAIANAANQNGAFDNQNIDLASNIVTINGAPVTLPIRPKNYFLGVVIDPDNQLQQIGKIGRARASKGKFTLVHPVGPPIRGLGPAGVVNSTTTGLAFPNPVGTTTIGYGNKISSTG